MLNQSLKNLNTEQKLVAVYISSFFCNQVEGDCEGILALIFLWELSLGPVFGLNQSLSQN